MTSVRAALNLRHYAGVGFVAATAALSSTFTSGCNSNAVEEPRVNGQVHLTMQIRYGGNGYLAPVTAKAEHITLG